MKAKQWLGFFVLGAFIVAICGLVWWRVRANSLLPSDDRLRVVTTFLPLYSFTAQVAGEDALVQNLLPPGVGPHDYAFTPADVETLATADVLVMNGLGLEEWLEDLITAANPDIRRVVASDGIETRAPIDVLEAGEAEEEEEHGPVDPHIWLDPIRAQGMVENIARGLSAADPAHAAGYGTRATTAKARLTLLDRDMAEALGSFGDKRFVAFHSAFQYFSERYGLVQVAVVQAAPGQDPSPRALAEIITLIKESGVRALFSEPQFQPKTIDTIVRETNLTPRVLDTIETGAFTPDAYEKAMRANLAAFVAAFRATP